MLVPYNRYLLVEPIDASGDRDDAVVLIPESSVAKPSHTLVKLVGVAPDCEKFNGEAGSVLLVNTNMLEEIRVAENNYTLVLENHVVGLYCEHLDGAEER